VYELVPGVATCLQEQLISVPNAVTEKVATQEFPYILHRVQFRRIGWQRQEADVVGHRQSFSWLVPAGAVEEQHGVGARRNLTADLFQMLGHRLTVHRRHDDGSTDAAFRTHCTEEVGGVVAVVANRRRA
jgi:hypothetical protein